MMYIAVCVIGKDICVVEGRIVSPFRLQCCRMVVTICRQLTKLFPPTWQHHHLMIASTIVPIVQHYMSLTPMVKQYGNGKANLRPDASLLQCAPRKRAAAGVPESHRAIGTPTIAPGDGSRETAHRI